jgi:hypothetical protein
MVAVVRPARAKVPERLVAAAVVGEVVVMLAVAAWAATGLQEEVVCVVHSGMGIEVEEVDDGNIADGCSPSAVRLELYWNSPSAAGMSRLEPQASRPRVDDA